MEAQSNAVLPFFRAGGHYGETVAVLAPDGLSYGSGAGHLGPLRVQVERRKLLFFPVFLFTAVQFCMGERDGLLAARAVSVTAGLALIPTLYYTYTGIWGDHTLWADAAIFYLSAAVTFWMDDLLHRQRRLWKMGCQVAGLVWLWVLAFLFVWWTFSPPHIALFRDPLTGLYGIP